MQNGQETAGVLMAQIGNWDFNAPWLDHLKGGNGRAQGSGFSGVGFRVRDLGFRPKVLRVSVFRNEGFGVRAKLTYFGKTISKEAL